jgi:hypothetical protein
LIPTYSRPIIHPAASVRTQVGPRRFAFLP